MHPGLGFSCLFFLLSLHVLAQAANVPAGSDPIVELPYGSFRGKTNGNVTHFLGMPFAASPVGDRRFGLPEPPTPFEGIREATSFGDACPQYNLTIPPQFPFLTSPSLVNASEDCGVFPIETPLNKRIPSHLPEERSFTSCRRCGFQVGDSSRFPGDAIVNRSLALGKDVVYVTANYRVGPFGFLGGKEVKAAGLGNAGLYDQRFALQWIQDHIERFGGNPKRVTICGQSAGAISVGLHMVINNGNSNGLFNGAIMESGSPKVTPDILHQQHWFDFLVDETNCTEAADRLQCLRDVPYEELLKAFNKTPDLFGYRSLTTTWQPMVDGKLIVRDPVISLQTRRYAKIPFITGDVEDEGTEFSYGSLNITTNEQFLEYMKTNYLQNITDSELQALVVAYPEDPTQASFGSPFNSGEENAITPQFKRIAAVQGDLIFQAPRRFFLEIVSKTQPAYAFRYMRGRSLPGFGSLHGSDLEEFFGLDDNADFIGLDAAFYLANNGNPNAPNNSISLLKNIVWEKWSSSPTNPPMLTFLDPAPSLSITYDTYRKDAMRLLSKLSLNQIGNGL